MKKLFAAIILFVLAASAAFSHSAEILMSAIPQHVAKGSSGYFYVMVVNRGSYTWDSNTRLGAVDDGDPFGGTRIYLPSSGTDSTITPGATHVFKFSRSFGNTTGTFTSDWRMVHDGVTWFGDTTTGRVTVENMPNTSLAWDINMNFGNANNSNPWSYGYRNGNTFTAYNQYGYINAQ
ncbi:MAG: hypothetical protein J6X53_01220, partial [Abditibacteriota bacterium]|nr:hypothetical protein [Abditibacteriota bacterium]